MTKKFATIRLPMEIVEELQVWRTAFERSYGRGRITYEFMIRGMLDCLKETEPGVFGEMEKMMEEDPSLLEKMGKYNYVNRLH